MILSEINIYPIKSTRRIALSESEVLPRGLPWDRRLMLVDTHGRFITAREHPRLALIGTRLGDGTLEVQVEGLEPLQLALRPHGSERISVTVWKDRCDALSVGEQADAWFSDYLGLPCRLVQMTDDLVRGVDQRYGQAGDEVSFADGFPLLLISQASLDDLNRRLQTPVSMRRFRPNLVIEGADAYGEDHWRRIRIGEVEFEGVKNCSRCVFTTIDPDTGLKDPHREPLRTLAGYRRKGASGVYFGQNLIPRSGGSIHIGDTVELLEQDQPRSPTNV